MEPRMIFACVLIAILALIALAGLVVMARVRGDHHRHRR